jgi:hypothetical protein
MLPAFVGGTVLGYLVKKGNNVAVVAAKDDFPIQAETDLLRRKRPIYYNTLNIDLTNARTGKESEAINVAGDTMLVQTITGSASIKLNDVTDEMNLINIALIRRVDSPFFRFFVINAAQPGKVLSLIVGRNGTFAATPTGLVKLANIAGAEINPATEDTLLLVATEATLAKFAPVAKAAVLNTAEPAAEAALIGAGVTPTKSPSVLRIYASFSNAGILRVARTVGGVTITEDMNGGDALNANAGYMFDIEWRTGDTVNLRYSVTGGTTLVIRVDEVSGGA